MCATCNDARSAPEHYRLFAEGCLYCAARRIQVIRRRLSIAPSEKSQRCRKALDDALALGLPELEIRRLCKLPEWQLAPPSSSAPRKPGG